MEWLITTMDCCVMIPSNGNISLVTGHLYGEFTGHWWIPLTKAGDRDLMFSMICAWINGCVNNREAGDLRRHFAHYDVTVMLQVQVPEKTDKQKREEQEETERRQREEQEEIERRHMLEFLRVYSLCS